MKVYGQLENAQFENREADYPAGVRGRTWIKPSNGRIRYDNGTFIKNLGGGGGAGSLLWEKTGDNSPTAEFVDGFHLESFSSVENQEIYAFITVPEDYDAGSPIKLINGSFFNQEITGKVLFRTQTTLVRDGVTVLGAYPNIFTSTNAEVTVNGVSNTLTSIGDIDLTSSIGQINGVSVAAGDKLRVRLQRLSLSESVSAVSETKLLINNFQLRFAV